MKETVADYYYENGVNDVWTYNQRCRMSSLLVGRKKWIIQSVQQRKGKGRQDWLYHFMKRHHELTLRQPEATSATRARAFNPGNVNFFYLLEPLIDQYKFPANNINNVDETGISTVQGTPNHC